MKKVLFAIIATVAMIGTMGLVFAQFNDTETGTNTFTAGTLDLTIDGLNGTVATFTASNLAPGSQPKHKYTLANIGSINGYLDIDSVTVQSLENTIWEPEAQAGDVTSPEGELDNVLNCRLFLDYNGDGWYSAGDVYFYNGLVSGLAAAAPFDLDELMPAGGGTDFIVELYDWWNTALDNQAMSDSLVIDIVFSLGQAVD